MFLSFVLRTLLFSLLCPVPDIPCLMASFFFDKTSCSPFHFSPSPPTLVKKLPCFWAQTFSCPPLGLVSGNLSGNAQVSHFHIFIMSPPPPFQTSPKDRATYVYTRFNFWSPRPLSSRRQPLQVCRCVFFLSIFSHLPRKTVILFFTLFSNVTLIVANGPPVFF